jgi:hypothetical protein
VRVAGREDDAPVAVDHGDRPVVDAVDGFPAGDEGERNVRWCRRSDGRQKRRNVR